MQIMITVSNKTLVEYGLGNGKFRYLSKHEVVYIQGNTVVIGMSTWFIKPEFYRVLKEKPSVR